MLHVTTHYFDSNDSTNRRPRSVLGGGGTPHAVLRATLAAGCAMRWVIRSPIA